MTGHSPEEDKHLLDEIKAIITLSGVDGIGENEIRLCLSIDNEYAIKAQFNIIKRYPWQHKCYYIDNIFYNCNEAARRFKNKYTASVAETKELTRQLKAATDRVAALQVAESTRNTLLKLLGAKAPREKSKTLELVMQENEEFYEIRLA